MIPVGLPVPPANYLISVRTPGLAFLATTPHPNYKQWRRKSFWTRIHDYMYLSFNGVCNYCSSWTPRNENTTPSHIHQTSIDHYVPKSANPPLAYEWTNFRLSRLRLNNRKDIHRDVVDPCRIGVDWFYLDFTSFLIRPYSTLNAHDASAVTATIERLELNSDLDYVNERIAIIGLYSLDRITLPEAAAKYPFIAKEIVAQAFDATYKAGLRGHFQAMVTTGSWSTNYSLLFP